MRKNLTLIAVTLGTLVLARHVEATDFVSNVNPSGDWNVPDSWNPKGIPAAGDKVTIVSGDTITLTDDRSALSLFVNPGGQFNVAGSDKAIGVLTLGEGGTPHLDIRSPEGVWLLGPDAAIRFAASTTITGSGAIRGFSGTAALVIAPPQNQRVTLTCLVPIRGALTIRKDGSGAGHFLNYRSVEADQEGGVLALDSSLDRIADSFALCSGARWRVSAEGAALRFDRGAIGLQSAFLVGPGTLEVNQTVVTLGSLGIGNGGAIVPGSSACFFFVGRCNLACPLIVSPVCDAVTCP